MASPSVAQSLAQTIGRVDYAREAAYYAVIAASLAEAFEPASAWTFSRKADAMIDEYIVNYDEYVGVGSGAFSYLDGTLYVNSFSLRDYEQALAQGRFALTGKRKYSDRARMRYRLMMSLFGLRLDKRSFLEDFGHTPERGLPLEIAGLRAIGAFDRNDAEASTLSERGRYLLVTMMREFFVGVNEVRDQAGLPCRETNGTCCSGKPGLPPGGGGFLRPRGSVKLASGCPTPPPCPALPAGWPYAPAPLGDGRSRRLEHGFPSPGWAAAGRLHLRCRCRWRDLAGSCLGLRAGRRPPVSGRWCQALPPGRPGAPRERADLRSPARFAREFECTWRCGTAGFPTVEPWATASGSASGAWRASISPGMSEAMRLADLLGAQPGGRAAARRSWWRPWRPGGSMPRT